MLLTSQGLGKSMALLGGDEGSTTPPDSTQDNTGDGGNSGNGGNGGNSGGTGENSGGNTGYTNT